MGDEEYEKFEITDYDLDNEFANYRPRRKLSKKQQMLGIWASDSDDDEDDRPSFSRGPRRKKNYSAPVNFVAGGIQQAGEPKEKKKDEDEDEDDEEEDDENDKLFLKNSSSESEDERPKFGKKNYREFDMGHQDIAGLRTARFPGNSRLMVSGVGNWEKHTKGIGAKLLLQMGFEPGKGLGKKLQGISAPVEVKLRKGRGAIGAYGPEKAPKIAETKVSEEKLQTKKVRKPNEIRTAEELIKEGRSKYKKSKAPSINTEIARCKVTDMTTKEQKTFSGYHALGKLHPTLDNSSISADGKSKVNLSGPDVVLHDLNTIIEKCEENIIHNDRRTKYLGDRVVSLEAEKGNLSKVLDQHASLISTLETVLAMLNRLSDRSNNMTLKEIADEFKFLQDKHYDEYKTYHLGELACNFIIPKFKENLSSWNPLTHPHLPLSSFKEWKEILEYGKTDNISRSMSPFDQLIWNVWMPAVRSAVQAWACRQPEGIIDLLEMWSPLLPNWILENILDAIILPKLTREVEEWNPLTDTVPIHTWIHPWLPLMKNRMDSEIYPVIRRKLGSALNAWHPSDRSARLMLQPWVQVFSKNDMNVFLMKNIVPKLQITLSELVINPHQQHLDHWNWVYDWKDLIPTHLMAGLLDKFFFPKWLQVLSIWLNHNPNYQQITDWYTGWKGMLSEKLLSEPNVKEHFDRALEMMNRAVSVSQSLQPGSAEQVSYLTTLERSQSQLAKATTISQPRLERLAEAVRTASQMPQGFKDLVQKKCEERGILFMPVPNRYREGKQIYKVGNVQAYIDSDIIFVCHNGASWHPTNLNTLLDTAEIG